MFFSLWSAFKQRGLAVLQRVREQVRAWAKPIAQTPGVGIVHDGLKSKADLVLENALLRQQLTVLDDAICERFIGSVRRECLNHLLIRDERHLFRLLKAYIQYFNTCRPHQGIGQRLSQPQPEEASMPQNGPIVTRPILGGLHHHYYRAAA
jgi:hypothetical protein